MGKLGERRRRFGAGRQGKFPEVEVEAEAEGAGSMGGVLEERNKH